MNTQNANPLFTKGNWLALANENNTQISIFSDVTYDVICVVENCENVENLEANANLIASSKDMYEQLNRCIDRIEKMQDVIHKHDNLQPKGSELGTYSIQFLEAKMAIQKAEGKLL